MHFPQAGIHPGSGVQGFGQFAAAARRAGPQGNFRGKPGREPGGSLGRGFGEFQVEAAVADARGKPGSGMPDQK